MPQMKAFTLKEVVILVIVIIAGIAFLETSGSMSSLIFWREFLLKLIVYCAASVFIVIIIGTFKKGD
jgi:hypothetical protein